MKKIIITYIIFVFFGCKSHHVSESKQKDFSLDYSYVFANIFVDDIKQQQIEDYIISFYKYSSKNEIPSEETHEKYTNYIISVTNEGEYTYSQLFEIKNQIFPVIKDVKIENKNLSITVEQGNSLERQSKKVDFILKF